MLSAFLHGLLLACGLILPLGPQNMWVFTQGATGKHFARALAIAGAAAICDTLLILLAVGGVSVVVLAVPLTKTALMTFGVLFLVYIGTATWRDAGKTRDASAAPDLPLIRQIAFTASISLLNPHALLDTIGVIGTSAAGHSGNARLTFTGACILVSWLWFAGLAVAGRVVGRADVVQKYLPRVSAVFLWASAAYLAWGLIVAAGKG